MFQFAKIIYILEFLSRFYREQLPPLPLKRGGTRGQLLALFLDNKEEMKK